MTQTARFDDIFGFAGWTKSTSIAAGPTGVIGLEFKLPAGWSLDTRYQATDFFMSKTTSGCSFCGPDFTSKSSIVQHTFKVGFNKAIRGE